MLGAQVFQVVLYIVDPHDSQILYLQISLLAKIYLQHRINTCRTLVVSCRHVQSGKKFELHNRHTPS